MNPSDYPRANLAGDLARIHVVITRGLQVGLDNSRTFARDGFPNAETKEGFVLYLQALTGTLHGHHLTEDEVAWPYLRERLPDAPYDALTADHKRMEAVVQEIQAATGRLAAGEDAEALSALEAALQRMQKMWAPHFHVEERHLTRDAVNAVMDAAEEGRLVMQVAQHAQEHGAPGPLGVPFLLYNLPPADRAVMAAAMPPQVTQELVPGPWKATWAPMAPFLLD